MKKSSLALITSAIISLPICGMEIEKISPGKEKCLEIIKQPRITQYGEWECLFCNYGGDKEGFSYSEQCADLVDNFINTTSKENCTVGLWVAISTPNLPGAIRHPETRKELIKKLIARQANTGPALQYLSQNITLYGLNYSNSDFIQTFNILCDANAFDEEALTSFKNAQNIFNWIITKLEMNRPK